ncbi:bifunctional nuclease family protein [Candidatus Woesearchaeota archaeon]|nr:bifunctional nuclease family protein [Candidatus Woesearchaeota archaeon]
MKNKTNYRQSIFFLFVIIVVLLNIFILYINYKTSRSLGERSDSEELLNYTLPELNLSNDPFSLEGFKKVKINLTDKLLVIQVNCSAIGLAVHEVQLYSIKQGLEKAIDLRPTVHDTMLDILNNFNISLFMVKITDARDDLYFANIYLKNGNNVLNIDAKPSDAIALAVRFGAPIYIKDSIINNYGQNVCTEKQ